MKRLRVAARGFFLPMFFVAITLCIYFFYVCEAREDIKRIRILLKLDIRWAVVMGTCITFALVCLPPVWRRLMKPSLPCEDTKGWIGCIQKALPRFGWALFFTLGTWFFHSIYMGGIADAHRDSQTGLKLAGAVIICFLGCLVSLFYPLLQKLAAYTDP